MCFKHINVKLVHQGQNKVCSIYIYIQEGLPHDQFTHAFEEGNFEIISLKSDLDEGDSKDEHTQDTEEGHYVIF